MKKIQINILFHFGREIFSDFILKYLIKIKNENKTKIKILSHGTIFSDKISNFTKELNLNGIESYEIYGGSYMQKIKNFLNTDSLYSCSMDDDILINNNLWDYMIENIDILENKDNLFLSPLISNGIPSVDLFIEDFMNDDDKKEMYNIFKNFHIDNLWGVDYSKLNKHTIQSNEWIFENFYDEVSKINHYYKGIHPVRASYEAQRRISEIIISNFDKFHGKSNYYLETIKRPYFCNSFYFIKTNIWQEIINDNSLFKDSFDEVPLNLYKDKHDLKMCFVRNGFCIHMAYNTIGKNQKMIENYYIEELKKNI